MGDTLKEGLKAILSHRVGRDKAITANYLAGRFGYKDDRLIRKAIEELIDDNFPVCSVTDSPAGYFFPSRVKEARLYSKALQSRAVRIFLRRRFIIKNTARYYETAEQGRLV